MVKLMVMSADLPPVVAAAAGAARARPQQPPARPPEPRRLDAEFVRDNALAIAGLLDREIGGPSAKPYQPAGYYANLQFPDRDYVADTRRPPVPPRRLHALAAHLPAPDAGQLRRALARGVHRHPHRRQHAAAGPDAAQRPDLRRGRPRLAEDAPGRPRRSSTDAERLDAPSSGPWPARQRAEDGRRSGRSSTRQRAYYRGQTRPRRRSCSRSASTAAPAAGGPRRSSPRGPASAASSSTCTKRSRATDRSPELYPWTPSIDHARTQPECINRRTFLGRSAYGLGAWRSARCSTRACSPPRRRRGGGRWTGVVNPPHFPPRPSASSTSAWRAARRTSKPSTTSPSSTDSTASRSPSRSPRASSSRSCKTRSSKRRGPSFDFRSYGKSGQEISDLFPHIAQHGRRHLHHPLDAHRADQPRPGACLHEHRLDHQGPAEHGLVAALRPGRRDRKPARLRRAHSRGQGGRRAAGLGAAMVGRLPAEQVPGRPVPVARATPSTTSATPTASARARSARWSRRSTRLNGLLRRGDAATPRSRRASRSTRWRSGCRRRCPDLTDLRSEPQDDPGHVRREAAGRRHVRLELPAGPPPGRARRALHPALSPRLGPPQRHRAGHADVPQATSTRPSAALVKDLKQRGMLDDTLVIWGGEFGRTPMGQGTRPRPPHPRLLDLAGRRRHQGRHHLRRHRRARLPLR